MEEKIEIRFLTHDKVNAILETYQTFAIFDGSDLTHVSAGINNLDNTSRLNAHLLRLAKQS